MDYGDFGNEFGENKDFEKGKRKKNGIIVAVSIVACVLILGSLCFAFNFGNLFKSNFGTVATACSKTFSEYFFEENADNKTFLNGLFCAEIDDYIEENKAANVEIKSSLKKFGDVPDLEGSEVKINYNVKQQESNILIDGKYNGISVSVLDAFFNDEYAVFQVPALSNKSFYVDWQDYIAKYNGDEEQLKMIKNIFSNEPENPEKLELQKEIAEVFFEQFSENVEVLDSGEAEINNHKCDKYTVSLDNKTIKEILNSIVDVVSLNDYAKETIINIYAVSNGFSATKVDYDNDYDAIIRNMYDSIEGISVDKVDVDIYINDDNVVEFDVFERYSDREFNIKASFLGEKRTSDNLKIVFEKVETIGGEKKTEKVAEFNDVTQRNSSIVENKKTFEVVADLDKSIVEFTNKINYDTDEFSGVISENNKSFGLEFNGTLKNEKTLFDLNFENVIVCVENEDVAGFDFNVKVGEANETDKKDKNSAIDIINADFETRSEIMQEFYKNLQKFGIF